MIGRHQAASRSEGLVKAVTPVASGGAAPGGVPDSPALAVRDLRVTLHRGSAANSPLVDGVSFSIARGETFGLVGESGSGKSMTAKAIMGLLRRERSITVQGSVKLDDQEVVGLSYRHLSALRGPKVGMVFQDAMSSLNPAYPVGEQIAESVRRHKGLGRREARRLAVEMLSLVEIPGAERVATAYPHQLSGGMRQRVMLAIAVSCQPMLLIADEPTTALDVTVQSQLLSLLRRLQQEMGMAILFITHDLAVLADVADRVAVMYAGQIVEEASVIELFEQTAHPYSSALLRSSPEYLGVSVASRPARTAGQVPSAGCRFRPRCEYASETCELDPAILQLSGHPGHTHRCLRVGEIEVPNAVDLWDREKILDLEDAGAVNGE
jgi:peptide/nickel transport system ATP-binding protein